MEFSKSTGIEDWCAWVACVVSHSAPQGARKGIEFFLTFLFRIPPCSGKVFQLRVGADVAMGLSQDPTYCPDGKTGKGVGTICANLTCDTGTRSLDLQLKSSVIPYPREYLT